MYNNTYVFRSSLWAIGGIGTVIWATSKHKTGRFWWFLGGAIIGGAVGGLIDYGVNSKNSSTLTPTNTAVLAASNTI